MADPQGLDPLDLHEEVAPPNGLNAQRPEPLPRNVPVGVDGLNQNQGGLQVQAQAPPPPPLVARPTTFSQLYADPSKDPLRDRYPAVIARFDTTADPPEDPEEVLLAALSNTTLPNTYLCCAALAPGRPKVYVVHKLSKYPRAFDGRETAWDNQVFGILGDTMGENAQIVSLPNTIFNFTNQATIYDDETFQDELTNLAADALFPRLPTNHHTAFAVRSHPLMYLPTKYAPIMFKVGGLTPKEAWLRLTPALQADGLLPFADPLLLWLRATMHATNHNNRGLPVTAIQLTNPFLDQDLIQHRTPLLLSALPHLKPTPSLGYDPAIMHLANAVAHQATEAREERIAREVERERPTLPSAKFNLLFDNLKSLLNVTEEDQLPEFWFSLAAASKKHEFGVVKQAFDAYARSNTAFIPQPPIPTPKLVNDLATINLVADHNDDLKTGIQPFVVMDGSEEFRLASLKIAQQYMIMAEQSLGLKVSDLAQLDVPKDLRAHPTTFYGLEKSLGLFGNLMGVVLGDNHPLTTNYRVFWKRFMGRQKEQMHYEIDERKVIKPVHILRNIQLITVRWFQAKCDGDAQTPPFLDILDRIHMANYSNPTLPGSLYQLIVQKPGPKFLSDASTVTTGLSTLTPGTTLPHPTSGASIAGGSIASGTIVTTTSAQTGRSGNYLRNPNVDSALQSLLPPGVKLLELLGNDPVPTGDDNLPICLAWHIRGGCFNNCRRRANHERILSGTEKTKLSNWMVDQTTKLRARFTVP